MIKNEEQLKKSSLKTGLILLIIAFVLSLIFKNMSYVGGFLVGFLFSMMIYLGDCEVARILLSVQLPKTSIVQASYFFIKMGIYALGFLAAVKIPGLINIYGVAIGYLTVKLTIFRLAMTRR